MASNSIPARRLTPGQNRFILAVQLLFFLSGLLLMVAGGTRVGIEFSEQLFGLNSDTFKDGIANWFGDTYTSFPILVIGGIAFLVGFGLWWGFTALGAKEPPAWHAGRNGLLALIGMLAALIAVTLWIRSQWLVFVVPSVVLVASLTVWMLIRFSQPDFRLVLGAERITRRPSRYAWILYAAIVIAISTLTVLGLVHAVLTDRIELPLPDVDAGELLYTTTFDSYNDEWDVYDSSKESAQIVPDESANNQLLITMAFDEAETNGIYSLLNRKFRDFDIRVTTTQLQSDEVYDNRLGIIFRYRDDQHYYAFEISGDGYYRLVKIEPSEKEGEDPVTIISTWNQTTIIPDDQFEPPYPTLIRPGSSNEIVEARDRMNEIRIIGKGDKFWFYINGQPMLLCLKGETLNSMWAGPEGCVEGNVATYVFEDDEYKQGKLGFFVGNTRNSNFEFPISIAFDDVIILGPPSRITVPAIQDSIPTSAP